MKKIILYSILISLGFTSCDFITEQPLYLHTPDVVFPDVVKAEQALNYAYVYIPAGYNRVGGSFLDAATTDAADVDYSAPINMIGRGFYTATNPVENLWYPLYEGVRATVFFEENIKYLISANGKTEEQLINMKKGWIAETRALRAFYYFELIKRYAGVPLVKDIYYSSDKAALLPRNNFSECVEYIVELCDSAVAEPNLPIAYSDQKKDLMGKMTKAAALAIKAKTLAYAASNLFNGQSNPVLGYTDNNRQPRFERAAAALAEVINLQNNGTNALTLYSNFEKMFITLDGNTEYIVVKGAGNNYNVETILYPPSLKGSGGMCPSQQLVESFDMKDGSPFNPSSPNPYENRDPRFYSTIVYNGANLGSKLGKVYTQVGDESTIDAIGAQLNLSTITGYYTRKFLDTNIDLRQSPTNTAHVWPHIRLGDIYLLYAEMMFAAYGATNDPKGYGMTALDAVNKIRQRAGITNNLTTLTEEKIRQERRVELAFEEQRYFDVKRWKIDEKELSQPVMGMRITNTNGYLQYTKIQVDGERHFTSKMYLNPVQYTQLIANPAIVQNPGW